MKDVWLLDRLHSKYFTCLHWHILFLNPLSLIDTQYIIGKNEILIHFRFQVMLAETISDYQIKVDGPLR